MIRSAALVLAFLWVWLYTPGQTLLIDEGFDDGNHSDDPPWIDEEMAYRVNSSKLLQLDAPPVAGQTAIATASSAAFGEWEAFVKLDYNPSRSNKAKFYLISDTPKLNNKASGYYIQVGDTPDDISLYREDEGSSSKLIDGTDGLTNTGVVTVRVRATRDLEGNWELFADTTGGRSYLLQGRAADHTYTISRFTGFLSDYTATRSNRFQYDDIRVVKTSPPLEITGVDLPDNHNIEITFNSNIDPSTVSPLDFSVNRGVGSPDAISLPYSNVVTLTYRSPLAGNRYILKVNHIKNTDGNPIAENTTTGFILFGSFSPGDIIINEIMYDPPGGQAEYVELRNTSGEILDLHNWRVGDERKTGLISPETVIMEADSFLVISTDTSALFHAYGPRPYVQMDALATFNNGGDAVRIHTRNDILVDSLRYSSEWGGDSRSLERRSAGAPSLFRENFGDSPHPLGGTPGATNEIAPDRSPPSFERLAASDSVSFHLLFSERLKTGTGAKAEHFTIHPHRSLQEITADGNALSLVVNPPLVSEVTYTVTARNLQDIFGNQMAPASKQFTFLDLPAPRPGDLRINEIMFNPLGNSGDPLPGQSEYIELYNMRDVAVSLEGISLYDQTGENGKVRSITLSSTADKWVPAGGLALIYADRAPNFLDSRIAGFFNLDGMHPYRHLRADRQTLGLASSGDAVLVADSSGSILDSVFYDQSWHNPNLIDTRGIALERIDPHGPGNSASNWSSSTTRKGGTPGVENTLQGPVSDTPRRSGINFYPNPFSPDNDGFEDYVTINYKLNKPDYLLNVYIYDRYGRPVRKLAEGEPAAPEGTLLWDGKKDDGSPNRIGIYIVIFEAFNSAEGRDQTFKKTVVIARKLN